MFHKTIKILTVAILIFSIPVATFAATPTLQEIKELYKTADNLQVHAPNKYSNFLYKYTNPNSLVVLTVTTAIQGQPTQRQTMKLSKQDTIAMYQESLRSGANTKSIKSNVSGYVVQPDGSALVTVNSSGLAYIPPINGQSAVEINVKTRVTEVFIKTNSGVVQSMGGQGTVVNKIRPVQ